jgi:hypothetical protein
MLESRPAVRREPSAVIWSWHGGEAEEQARAREAAAARRHGLLGGAVGVTLAAALYFLAKRPHTAAVVATVTVLTTLLALAAPLTGWKAFTRVLDRFAHGVATGVTWMLMTVLYFVVFLPLGLFLRTRGKLAITRAFDSRLSSYWKSLEGAARPPESYRRQF